MTWTALSLAALLITTARASALSGPEIIAQAQARNGFSTWHDRRSGVTLENVEEGSGRTGDAEVLERSDPQGEHRTLITFLSPTDRSGTRFLHVSPRGSRDQWWTWSPATRRVRKLGGTAGGLQRDEVFVGRDLSYGDLELLVRIQQWSDADATTTLEEEAACGDGRTCYRLALVPAKGNDEFPCARYRLWFSRDDLLLRRAELYGPDDRLMKTITCEGVLPERTLHDCPLVQRRPRERDVRDDHGARGSLRHRRRRRPRDARRWSREVTERSDALDLERTSSSSGAPGRLPNRSCGRPSGVGGGRGLRSSRRCRC